MATRSIKINAFTIMEVIIVLVILSILLTIMLFSLNRFQLSLKVNQTLMEEINQFESFRATLRQQLYNSDSVVTTKDNVFIYSNQGKIHYQIIDEYWYMIKDNTEPFPINVKADQIEVYKIKETEWIDIPVYLGETKTVISSPKKMDTSNEINDYFNTVVYEQ